MFGVFATHIFYTEVVDAKGEVNWVCFVSPKSRCVAFQRIAEGGKDVEELFVGKYASLGETVHVAENFTKYVSVADKSMEVIFVHDLLGQRPNWYLHVFVS